MNYIYTSMQNQFSDKYRVLSSKKKKKQKLISADMNSQIYYVQMKMNNITETQEK